MTPQTIVILTVLSVISIMILRIVLSFVFARYKAIRGKNTELDLLRGWVKLILWQPNEGVVVLRNKQVHFVDQSGKGGTKYIFPIKGDELRGRENLSVRFITWEDPHVLTRESLQVYMKVVVWWRISSVEKYVFEIDRAVHVGEEHQQEGLLESAERWLKAITESTIRVLVSKATIDQLISTTATRYLKAPYSSDGSEAPELDIGASISETIAFKLHEDLEKKVESYGISINKVEIQEISLAPEVQEAINKVWIAFLKPIQTEQEARARQIELEASAKVLGTDAIALNEILKNFQGSNFYMIPPFLQTLFGMVDTKTQRIDVQPGLPSEQQKRLPNSDKPALDEGAKKN